MCRPHRPQHLSPHQLRRFHPQLLRPPARPRPHTVSPLPLTASRRPAPPLTLRPPHPHPTFLVCLWVFFGWIPALIFFLIEKGKVAPNYDRANAANLNFQIVIAIGIVASYILSFVLIGLFTLPLVYLAQLIIGIIHAINVPPQLAAGQEGKFYLAPSWVK